MHPRTNASALRVSADVSEMFRMDAERLSRARREPETAVKRNTKSPMRVPTRYRPHRPGLIAIQKYAESRHWLRSSAAGFSLNSRDELLRRRLSLAAAAAHWRLGGRGTRIERGSSVALRRRVSPGLP